MCKIFDSHAHYDDSRFDGIRNDLINTMPENGVCGILNCAVDYNSSLTAVEYTKKFNGVFAAVGIHPQEVCADTFFSESDFAKLLNCKKVVAMGEIGLDYYWDTTFKEKQKQILIQQLKFANKFNLPISFHDREAHADSLEILKQLKPKGAVHCFSGSVEMAEEILKLGMYIGVGGVITFKNAKKLAEVVKFVPLERILLETDAPYLAPEPFRGQTNNSAYIKYIAKAVADIKNMSVDEVLAQTCFNAEKLFNIK